VFDIITVKSDGLNKNEAVLIYNTQGQLLIQKTLIQGKTSRTCDIDISALPKAMYILKIENTDGVWVKKFVKE